MTIGFPSKAKNKGGPGSFQVTFENHIKTLGWRVIYPEDKIVPHVILIPGGTRKLFWLIKMKRKGAKIFFRLGGINWLYKYKSVPLFRKLYLNIQIFLTPYIQKFFSDGIIYQSNFSKEWLLKLKQSYNHKNNTIIYNGVDLTKFYPSNNYSGEISLLCIEGNIDYSPYSIDLLNQLQERLINKSSYKSLLLYGNFENPGNIERLHPDINYKGYIRRDEISKVYKNAVYLSLDVNAACPNTVIEALASGIPVIGFDTGALKELVPPEAGEIVPYGGDPWKLDFPDVEILIEAAKKVLNNWENYSKSARILAEERFSLTDVAEKYILFLRSIA